MSGDRCFLDFDFELGMDLMVVVGHEMPIRLYRVSDGAFISSFAWVSVRRDCPADRWSATEEFHGGGYRNVAFLKKGELIVAGRIDRWITEVYDVKNGSLVGSFFGSNTCFGKDESLNLLASPRNDQGGCAIRFARLDENPGFACHESGWAAPRAHVSPNEDEDGWYPDVFQVTGISFSGKSDYLAVVGGFPFKSSKTIVVAFPSLNQVFTFSEDLPVYFIEKSRFTLQSDRAGVPLERAVFRLDGNGLYVPLAGGAICEFDFNANSEVGRQKIHQGVATSLDLQSDTGVLVSVSGDGEVAITTTN